MQGQLVHRGHAASLDHCCLPAKLDAEQAAQSQLHQPRQVPQRRAITSPVEGVYPILLRPPLMQPNQAIPLVCPKRRGKHSDESCYNLIGCAGMRTFFCASDRMLEVACSDKRSLERRLEKEDDKLQAVVLQKTVMDAPRSDRPVVGLLSDVRGSGSRLGFG
ncbi:hypothetical protein BDZ85DRAFT_132818 [Elsinoe ampelina]|uniref:Uncharacterized protein n=1 Tax=Elsinoe ampelina TaxID=302913 RepID=A0A6A6G7S9_9PEZI|nr:hypothetical protein BDZ85DRAFT_132818 [Elsinoe ampelina]